MTNVAKTALDREAMTPLEEQAREAAIDHGMWLAPDDDETNYQAFVAGYYRGWSDKGAEVAKADEAAAEPREREIEALKAKVEERNVKILELSWQAAAWVRLREADPFLRVWSEEPAPAPRE